MHGYYGGDGLSLSLSLSFSLSLFLSFSLSLSLSEFHHISFRVLDESGALGVEWIEDIFQMDHRDS